MLQCILLIFIGRIARVTVNLFYLVSPFVAVIVKEVVVPLMCWKLLTRNAVVHLVLIEGLSPIPHPLESRVEVGGVHGNANDFEDTKN